MPKRKPARPKEVLGVERSSVSKIKRRIRDIQRTLLRPDKVDTAQRQEAERALDALKAQLVTAEQTRVQAESVRKTAKKYHMVRFFERKKATRRLNAAAANLFADPENAQLQAEFARAEIDWFYTVQFPAERKYVALYAAEDSRDEIFWAQIKQEMDQQTHKRGLTDAGRPRALVDTTN